MHLENFSIIDNNNDLNFLELERGLFDLASDALQFSQRYFFFTDCFNGVYLPKVLTNVKSNKKHIGKVSSKYSVKDYQSISQYTTMLDNEHYSNVTRAYSDIEKFFNKKLVVKFTLLKNLFDLFEEYCNCEVNFYKNFYNFALAYRSKYGKDKGVNIPVLKQKFETCYNYKKLPFLCCRYLNFIINLEYDAIRSPNPVLDEYGLLRILKAMLLLQYDTNKRGTQKLVDELQRVAMQSVKQVERLVFVKDGNNSLAVQETNILIKKDIDFFRFD